MTFVFRFEQERTKLAETIKLLEQGLSERQTEVVALKTSNEGLTNKLAEVCGDDNVNDIKQCLAGKRLDCKVSTI